MSNVVVPIVVAFISAMVVLVGYANERKKDRDNRLQETRKEIYQKLIANLTKMTSQFEIMSKDKDMPENDDLKAWYSHIQENHPVFWDNMYERMEIQSLIAVYGNDESIKAIASFWRDSIAFSQKKSTSAPDLARMILELRQSLFDGSKVSKDDIQQLLNR
jgi:hypothetical protein